MLWAAVVLGAAPSLFLLVFFYLKDRYEPEPRGHVALAFVKGMASFLPALFAARWLASSVGATWLALGGLEARLFETFVLASLVEELAKWSVFLALIYWWSELDEPLDGVVYGVALALGFATVENILCVLRDGLRVGLLRAVFAVPAHALFGAAMGFYFGRAKLGNGRDGVTSSERATRIVLALAVPVAFHGAYDFTLVELSGGWMYAVVGVFSLLVWIFVLRRVHRAQSDSPFRHKSPIMKRTILALLLMAGCSHKEATSPKFDQQWKELAQAGAEPLFIEGDRHGAGLMGEVRRSVDPPDRLSPLGASAFQGALPDPEVVRVIRSNLPAVKGCYAIEEKNGTVGSGKAIVSIEIDPAGSVSQVRIDAPAFASSGLPSCVSARAKSWTFPKFTQGPKKFSYPFVFVGG